MHKHLRSPIEKLAALVFLPCHHIFDSYLSLTLSFNTIWLYVIIVSSMSFRLNPHSVVCLNAKELLARSRRHIWNLSDSDVIRTHNHLVRKQTLNHLDKMTYMVECLWCLSVWLNGWVFVYKPSGCGFESRCCHLTLYICTSIHIDFLCVYSLEQQLFWPHIQIYYKPI